MIQWGRIIYFEGTPATAGDYAAAVAVLALCAAGILWIVRQINSSDGGKQT